MSEIVSHRTEQVADQIKRVLSSLLVSKIRNRELHRVTITQVLMSRDLREAKIYFDMMGDASEIKKIILAFKKATGFIRHELAQELSLKQVPNLFFFYDETREIFERAQGVLEEIHHGDETPGNK